MSSETKELTCPECGSTDAFKLSSVLYARYDVKNLTKVEKEEIEELDTADAVTCSCGHKDYLKNFLGG